VYKVRSEGHRLGRVEAGGSRIRLLSHVHRSPHCPARKYSGIFACSNHRVTVPDPMNATFSIDCANDFVEHTQPGVQSLVIFGLNLFFDLPWLCDRALLGNDFKLDY
jgi:hypothetical protein